MLRKITSLTALWSFLVMLITSVILYVVPQGRVAYWADWHFLWLSKDDWGNVHVAVGALFLLSLLLHIWLNWKPIMAYMKNKAHEMTMTPSMVISLVLTLFVAVGTLVGLPPMQQLLDLSASIKDDAIEVYGNPPYGHAEQSPLKKFCGYLGMDVDEALAALRAAGYPDTITGQTEIREIARLKGVSPQQVFNDMRPASSDPFAALPPNAPEGTGKLKLADLCASFGLPVDDAIAKLAAKGITATADMNLKTIAGNHNMNPHEVYQTLRSE